MKFCLFIALIILHLQNFATEKLFISEPTKESRQVSGDNQHGSVGENLNHPLTFFVSDSVGHPSPNQKVYLDLLYTPGETSNRGLSQKLLFTDSLGMARANFLLGDKAGEYAVLAKLDGTTEHNRTQFVVYRFYARETSWAFQMSLGLLGGLALFLFGIYLMSEGLKKTAGDKMRTILGKLTNNRIMGVGLGTIGTVIIPSSSAISVMLVSFVNAGLMTFKQTLPVILGAAIGTTIIAQLIAFNLSDYSLLFIAIGALLHLFANNDKLKNTGEGLLGFGILFYGMDIMAVAMNPLRTYQPFISLILQLENPILGVLLGTILTALIQSSSAFIGILMILASQGLVSLELSMAFVLGANLGTPITALLACIKTTREAQKVAVAQFVYKLFLVGIFIWLIGPVATLIQSISPDSVVHGIQETENLPRQIANSHTLFNIALTIIALPLISQFATLISKLFKPENSKQQATKYINDSVLETPSLAIDLAKKEISRLWKSILIVHEATIEAFITNDINKLGTLETERDKFKSIRDEVSDYLFKILQKSGKSTSAKTYKTLHILAELSHINELLTKTLHRRAEKWIRRNYSFSEESKIQLIDFHNFATKMLNRSLQLFNELDTDKAIRMDEKYQAAKELANELEQAHFERMRGSNEEDIQNSKTYIELIYTYRTVNEHCRNIAKSLLNDEVAE